MKRLQLSFIADNQFGEIYEGAAVLLSVTLAMHTSFDYF